MAKKTTTAKGNKVTKGNKQTTTTVKGAKVVTPPQHKEGIVAYADQLPAKVASAIGTLQTVKGKQVIITHVGAEPVHANGQKPQALAISAIIKLMQAGHSVLAANTMRYLTEKKMKTRKDQSKLKTVVVINK